MIFLYILPILCDMDYDSKVEQMKNIFAELIEEENFDLFVKILTDTVLKVHQYEVFGNKLYSHLYEFGFVWYAKLVIAEIKRSFVERTEPFKDRSGLRFRGACNGPQHLYYDMILEIGSNYNSFDMIKDHYTPKEQYYDYIDYMLTFNGIITFFANLSLDDERSVSFAGHVYDQFRGKDDRRNFFGKNPDTFKKFLRYISKDYKKVYDMYDDFKSVADDEIIVKIKEQCGMAQSYFFANTILRKYSRL